MELTQIVQVFKRVDISKHQKFIIILDFFNFST
jgi:hypothetical protein